MNTSPAPGSPSMVNPPDFHGWARWFWPTAFVTLVADQLTKFAVHGLIVDGKPLPNWIGWAYNTGVAWSLFDAWPGMVALATLVLIPVLVLVWWRSFRRIGRFENLAFGLILGGAVGNAIDRIAARFGAFPGVRDFIHVDLGFWPFAPWPMFNLADAGITVGFAVLLLRSFVTTNAPPAAAG